MGKRPNGFYPTDPYATEALRLWLEVAHPDALAEPWLDPCAGYGALLQGLVLNPWLRHAIELQEGLRTELVRRVVPEQLQIGNGLARAWYPSANIVENPNFHHDTMVAFVRRALDHRRRSGKLVCVFALSTFWHSEGARDCFRDFARPDWTLGLGFRATCDGSEVGDMRSHDWLVWDGSHRDPWSRCVVLPRPEVNPTLLRDHTRLSRLPAPLAANGA